MKNILKFSVFALFVSLTACNKGTSDSGAVDAITIIHELDTVKVKKNPINVVALDYAALENLDLLGIKVLGVPKEHLPDHLSKYKEDSNVADVGSVKEVNFEKIAALNPDVIFMSERLEKVYPELKKIAPTVFLKTNPKDFVGSVKKIAGYFAEIFDKKEFVDGELSKIDKKIADTKEKTSKAEGEGLVTLFNNGKFSAYGKGSRFGMIHEVLGVKEAVEGIDATARHGQAVSSEFIQQTNPDYLFVLDRGAVVDGKAADKKDIENVLVQQTKAFKNGKIIYLNPEIWYLSGAGIPSVNAMIDAINKEF